MSGGAFDYLCFHAGSTFEIIDNPLTEMIEYVEKNGGEDKKHILLRLEILKRSLDKIKEDFKKEEETLQVVEWWASKDYIWDQVSTLRAKVKISLKDHPEQMHSAGWEDIEGPHPEIGDSIDIYDPNIGIYGTAEVVKEDIEKQLIYMKVDWFRLRGEEENERNT